MEPSHPNFVKSLLLKEKYSDFIISCEDRTFPVHRNIVCSQSPFFEAALDGRFAEAQSGRIILEEDNPKAVERMLSWMYTGTYEEPDSNTGASKAPSTPILTIRVTENGGIARKRPASTDNSASEDAIASAGYNNLDVYLIADKYGVGPLKDVARQKFIAWFKKYEGEELPDVTRKAFSTLPAHDHDLRNEIILSITNSTKGEMFSGDEFVRVFVDCGVIDVICKNLFSRYKVGKEAYKDQQYGLEDKVVCADCTGDVTFSEDEEWQCVSCDWKV